VEESDAGDEALYERFRRPIPLIQRIEEQRRGTG